MPTSVRWIAQKNKFSCGPIAILNILKWVGFPVSYKKDYNFWKKKCKCNCFGTHQSNKIDKIIRNSICNS